MHFLFRPIFVRHERLAAVVDGVCLRHLTNNQRCPTVIKPKDSKEASSSICVLCFGQGSFDTGKPLMQSEHRTSGRTPTGARCLRLFCLCAPTCVAFVHSGRGCTVKRNPGLQIPVERKHPNAGGQAPTSPLFAPTESVVRMDGKAKPPCASTKPWFEMKWRPPAKTEVPGKTTPELGFMMPSPNSTRCSVLSVRLPARGARSRGRGRQAEW